MRFSSKDIRHQTFERRFRGLAPDQVEEFLDALAQEWESLSQELAHLHEQVDEQARELRDYRSRERSLLDALETARKAGEQMRQTAEQDARRMVAEAELQSREILQRTQDQRAHLRQQCFDLQQKRQRLLAELEHVLTSHRQLVELFSRTPADEDDDEATAAPRTPPPAPARRRPTTDPTIVVDDDDVEVEIVEPAGHDTMMGLGVVEE